VVSIVSWKWLIADRGGLVNIGLAAFGLGPIYFLSQSGWAMVAVIVIKIWRSFPFIMLSLLAQLQVIDRTLYEAGKLDGASHWQLFWHITLPHLKNISIVQAILMVIWSINDFETPFLLTQGGPSNATENLILLSYRYTFGRNDIGRGSAVAILTLILLMVLATLMLRQQRKIAQAATIMKFDFKWLLLLVGLVVVFIVDFPIQTVLLNSFPEVHDFRGDGGGGERLAARN
jgi:ABC-type sugar transport system permease subunit